MGTMRERSPGTWELAVSAGWDPGTAGYRRVIRTVRTTSRREAKTALARLEVEVASGRVGPSDPTVAELLERWMEHLERLGRSDSTLYNYRRYINRELRPTIGGLRLSKLTARDLDGLYTALTRRGLAPATVRQIHAVMRAALNQAVRWGMVGRNVATLASAPFATPARAAPAVGSGGSGPHRRGRPARPDVRVVRPGRRRHGDASGRGVWSAVERRRSRHRTADGPAQSSLDSGSSW